jgi:hypothetical protein
VLANPPFLLYGYRFNWWDLATTFCPIVICVNNCPKGPDASGPGLYQCTSGLLTYQISKRVCTHSLRIIRAQVHSATLPVVEKWFLEGRVRSTHTVMDPFGQDICPSGTRYRSFPPRCASPFGSPVATCVLELPARLDRARAHTSRRFIDVGHVVFSILQLFLRSL